MRFMAGLGIIMALISGCSDKSDSMNNKEISNAWIKLGKVAVPLEKDTLTDIKDELKRLTKGQKRQLVHRDFRPPQFDKNDPYIEIDVRNRYDTGTMKIICPLLPDKAQLGYIDPGDNNEAVAMISWDGARALAWFRRVLPEIERSSEANVRSREGRRVVTQCKKDLIDFISLREEPRLIGFEEVYFKDEYLDEQIFEEEQGIKGYRIKLLAQERIYYYHATGKYSAHLIKVENL